MAAYTRARHEHQVARQLTFKGLESLLPTFARLTRWTDRIKRAQSPLFPGYVFVRAADHERLSVLETVGVVQLVSFAGKVAVLTDSDVELLRACVSGASDVEPHPFLRIGQRVRVKYGPFTGCEGVLVDKHNSQRLVITIDHIMKSVAINLHGADVQPC